MDTAEWNSNMLRILSRLSPLSRCIRTNAAKMHHACKAWCIVSTSGRFARLVPGLDECQVWVFFICNSGAVGVLRIPVFEQKRVMQPEKVGDGLRHAAVLGESGLAI